MSSRRLEVYGVLACVIFVASAAMAQGRAKAREREPAKEGPRRRQVEELLRYGRELSMGERMKEEQRRMDRIRSGLTERQYQRFLRYSEFERQSEESDRRSREQDYARLLADPELRELAMIVSCVPCVHRSPYDASTLRNIVRRTDGATNALLAAYRGDPMNFGMRDAFTRALGAGAPIPTTMRVGTFDAWVRTLGPKADLLEVLWKDAAMLRESDPALKWEEALHGAARKYRQSKRLTLDDPALEEVRTAALLRRLREAGCL